MPHRAPTYPPDECASEFGDDPNDLPGRSDRRPPKPLRPHEGYRFFALPATAAYVPDNSYRVDLAEQVLLHEGVPVAVIRADGRPQWSARRSQDEFARWAEDLRWIQQVPAATTLTHFGFGLLLREARTAAWCEKQSKTALMYSTVDEVRRGRWRAEELLKADRPEDLQFLARVDPRAAYYWHRGRRHVLVPGLAELLPESSAGGWLADVASGRASVAG
ncbi:hypothetical protein [Rhodococcus sp. HS-D2]|uniref:hypothetical protein n=1 Tax=Rhodococcus sp. HS-D2 TaxID=1384636 RepID=UPI000B1D7975|nr:hypothetical protein [Rhodococcus sp. HS-D2]